MYRDIIVYICYEYYVNFIETVYMHVIWHVPQHISHANFLLWFLHTVSLFDKFQYNVLFFIKYAVVSEMHKKKKKKQYAYYVRVL